MLEYPRKIRWSKSQINNKSVLFPVMAWRRTGDKPLPEPMMTHVNNAYMRHPALLRTHLGQAIGATVNWTSDAIMFR